MTLVTARRAAAPYISLIEHGELHMTAAISTKITTLALAAALFLPGALAALNQAAQIVA